jgi:hypothetical protein
MILSSPRLGAKGAQLIAQVVYLLQSPPLELGAIVGVRLETLARKRHGVHQQLPFLRRKSVHCSTRDRHHDTLTVALHTSFRCR